jgi:hypothetical protein
MRRSDLALIAVWSAVVLALAGSALWSPALSLFSYGDLHTYHYPMRHLAASALQAGRLPFWNPYILSGLPLLANPQSVLFYPVSALGFTLPLSLALTWDSVLHLLWAGLGVTLLARREGLASGKAAALAAGYALSPFLIYRVTAGIPTLVAALAWAPWCWLALLSRSRGLLAAAWALQALSGHPQFLIVNAAGMALWAGLRRPVLWLEMTQAAGGALLLTCLQWVPTAQFLANSVRTEWPEAFARAYSVEPRAWLTMLAPGALGVPIDGTYSGLTSYFFESTGVFIGLALLASARFTPATAVLLAVGLLLPLGFSGAFLRTPARWQLLALWALLAAAGRGLRGLSPAVSAAVLAATLLQLFAWDSRFLKAEPAGRYLAPNPRVAAQITGPFRVLTDPQLANPNKTMLYRAFNVNGYEAFYLRRYAAIAAASEGAPAADSSRVFMSKPSEFLHDAGLGAVLDRFGAVRSLRGAGLAYPARGIDIAGTAAVFLPRPERWLVTGSISRGADRVVVTVPDYPGWSARLNGSQVELEPHGYFLAARAPEGPFSLELKFSPPWWGLLALLSSAAWLALAWRVRGA